MKKSLNFFRYLIYILPAAIVSGPFISDAIVTISSLFFLFYSIKNKNFTSLNNIFFKLFLIFWFYLIISSFFSMEVLVSLKTSIPYIRFALFTCFIIFLVNENEKFIKNFSIYFIIIYCVVLFDSYVQYFFGSNIIGLESPQGDRLSSFFGEEMIVGSFLSRLFPLVLFCILFLSKKLNKNIKYFSAILLILTDVIIFLTGERTSFGILLIINVGFIILINQMKILRIFTFVTSILLISFITIVDSNVKNRMIDQTINEFTNNSTSSNISKEGKLKTFSIVHQDHYETAINMFKHNPIIGVGPKMFRYECHKEEYLVGKWGCTSHPHHFHIQILAETGIIGYLFIFFGIFFVLKKFIVTIYQTYFTSKEYNNIYDLKNCILIGIFANIFPLLPSGNVFNNWLSIVYFLPVGFYFYKTKND